MVNCNGQIRDAIQKIALRGFVNPQNNTMYSARKIVGYVTKIDIEAGTVDVQEYNQIPNTNGSELPGYHEAVRLSALPGNTTNIIVVPKLYSDVVIVCSPDTLVEYVIMCSQVAKIRHVSDENVEVGVVELDEFNLQDTDGPDVSELQPTGVHAKTTYTKDGVVIDIAGKEQDQRVKCSFQNNQIIVDIAGKISMTLDGNKLSLNGDQFGGLIKIEELTNKLNDLVNAFNSHVHSLVNVPITTSQGPGNIVSGNTLEITTKTSRFNKSDYENSKVVHG